MKKETHPENHRPVIFNDTSSDAQFLVLSTVETEERGKWTDGTEYDLYNIEISSASHPFYTGTEKVIDTAGRVDKFKQRMKKAQQTTPKKKSKVAEEK